ncbi:serine protease 27-like [Latimeria chalumnae]|uniref:serine protease 27-like n=1 Tax=Latimeria chalumnae TaxID=7897 RepID=UPI00313B074B
MRIEGRDKNEIELNNASRYIMNGMKKIKQRECGKPVLSKRIVGGADATEGAWPWQASLHKDFRHICGAVLITNKWALSAAHCFENMQSFDRKGEEYAWLPSCLEARQQEVLEEGGARLSSSRYEVSRGISKLLTPISYTIALEGYDIALIELSSSVSYTDYILPACLPTNNTQFPEGMKCWVTGWGRDNSSDPFSVPNTLQELEVPIIGQERCNCEYSELNITVLDGMVCTVYKGGGKGACNGDSGGPLVCKVDGAWILTGLVSWGPENCSYPLPSVYTSVAYYQSVIQELVPEVEFVNVGPVNINNPTVEPCTKDRTTPKPTTTPSSTTTPNPTTTPSSTTTSETLLWSGGDLPGRNVHTLLLSSLLVIMACLMTGG